MEYSEQQRVAHATNAYRAALCDTIRTYAPDQCTVQYEPVDSVIRLSDSFILKRSEFHRTDDGAMVDGDCVVTDDGPNVSRIDCPDGLNMYNDFNLLHAVWYLRYATVSQCVGMLLARKRISSQLYISSTTDVDYVSKRLSSLAKQNLLWAYKVNFEGNRTIRVYSLTSTGTDFLTAASGLPFRVYPFTSAAIPAVLLGRLSENEIIKEICKSKKNISFEKPHLWHGNYELEEKTGEKCMDIDYYVTISEGDNVQHVMVQFIRDPQWCSEIYSDSDMKTYYSIQALLSKSFLLKKGGKDGSRGEAKVLFVCPTVKAFTTILRTLNAMDKGEYLSRHFRRYIFTSEKATVLVKRENLTINEAMFGINHVLNKEKTGMEWKISTPPGRIF